MISLSLIMTNEINSCGADKRDWHGDMKLKSNSGGLSTALVGTWSTSTASTL